jgi:predicted enzyme related to lactoylglutathione lyase
MKYLGSLVAVKDIAISKEFYKDLLEQTIVFDMGTHVTFEGGFSLQQDYADMIGLSESEIIQQSNAFQLYFEVSDLDDWNMCVKKVANLVFLHKMQEYPWGQRSLRLYDPDKNIVEIAESMENVILRFLKKGLSADETAKRTMFPIEYISNIKASMEN